MPSEAGRPEGSSLVGVATAEETNGDGDVPPSDVDGGSIFSGASDADPAAFALQAVSEALRVAAGKAAGARRETHAWKQRYEAERRRADIAESRLLELAGGVAAAARSPRLGSMGMLAATSSAPELTLAPGSGSNSGSHHSGWARPPSPRPALAPTMLLPVPGAAVAAHALNGLPTLPAHAADGSSFPSCESLESMASYSSYPAGAGAFAPALPPAPPPPGTAPLQPSLRVATHGSHGTLFGSEDDLTIASHVLHRGGGSGGYPHVTHAATTGAGAPTPRALRGWQSAHGLRRISVDDSLMSPRGGGRGADFPPHWYDLAAGPGVRAVRAYPAPTVPASDSSPGASVPGAVGASMAGVAPWAVFGTTPPGGHTGTVGPGSHVRPTPTPHHPRKASFQLLSQVALPTRPAHPTHPGMEATAAKGDPNDAPPPASYVTVPATDGEVVSEGVFVECSRAGQESGPRSVASTRLLWMTPPRTVLVVAKDARAPLFHDTLRLLGTAKRLAVYVEPSAYRAVAALAPLLDAAATGDCHVDGGLLSVLHTWADDDRGVGASSGGRAEEPARPPSALMNKVDLIITLGGDGTVLWVSSLLGDRPVPPLVSFHLGSLGFMTPFPPSALRRTVDAILQGGFELQLRHRLQCCVLRGGGAGGPGEQEGAEKAVLNEVVIDRGMSPFLTQLECYCDDAFITTVQGDGLIVSTPSGSTAYSLAAGGSMVHPQVPGMLFTPICPHSLSFRPLVFPDCVTLRVAVPAGARGTMWASFDGKDRVQLGAGDAVLIRMSRWPMPAVCESDATSDWLRGAREGLNWNLRKVQGEREAEMETLRLV